MPKVSIILPIYNVEKYLDKCLESVCGQTLKDIEIICVIDASPDNSIDICRKWQKKDKRIIIVDEKENKGLGLTRNVGLQYVHGEYVAFVDSDDYIHIEMYERLYEYATKHKLDMCRCNFVRDTDGAIARQHGIDEEFVLKGREAVDEYLLDMVAPLPSYPHDVKHIVSVCLALYSTKIIKDNGILFESERKNASEDMPFNIEFLSKAESIGGIPFDGYYYRYNPISLSRGYSHKKFQAWMYLLDEIEWLLSNVCSKEKYLLHYQRFVFYVFRIMIKYESFKNIDGKRIEYIAQRCDDRRMQPLYKTYPYKLLPMKQRICFVLMKYKCATLLHWMSQLENKLNKCL